MKHTSYSNARNQLKDCMQHVIRNSEPMTITRFDGDSVVMLSSKDYKAIIETMYVLGREDIIHDIRIAEDVNAKFRTLDLRKL